LEGQSCLLSGGTPDSPVCHRTTTVHVWCPIPFQIGCSRPLQICGSWRTGHCPVPLPTVGASHASPADLAADRCAGGRWLTGQSGAPPDSPVNYSRTPLKFSREWPVRRSWPGAPDTIGCTTGQSGVPDRAESWLLQPSPFLFLFSLILAHRQTSLVSKTNELSLETYLLVDLHFIHHMAYNNPLNMCWTLNHQNILEMVQGHISLSGVGCCSGTLSLRAAIIPVLIVRLKP
jgi:hypothetical protein